MLLTGLKCSHCHQRKSSNFCPSWLWLMEGFIKGWGLCLQEKVWNFILSCWSRRRHIQSSCFTILYIPTIIFAHTCGSWLKEHDYGYKQLKSLRMAQLRIRGGLIRTPAGHLTLEVFLGMSYSKDNSLKELYSLCGLRMSSHLNICLFKILN